MWKELINGYNMRQIISFAIVGTIGAVVNLDILYSLTEYVGLYYLLSNLIAIEVSILCNFTLNDKFVFKDRKRYTRRMRFIGYHVACIGGTMVTFITLATLVEVFKIWYVLASMVAIVLSFLVNYTLSKYKVWIV